MDQFEISESEEARIKRILDKDYRSLVVFEEGLVAFWERQ
jgi:hypothetical protein